MQCMSVLINKLYFIEMKFRPLKLKRLNLEQKRARTDMALDPLRLNEE